MKKLSLALASLALSFSAFAQEAQSEPNRLLIYDTNNNFEGYVLDRVQNLQFARVDGVAQAEVEISDVTLESVTLDITMSEECWSYAIDVVPQTVSNMFVDNPLAAISYVNRYGSSSRYYEDFTDGILSGVEFKPSTDYTIVTIGYDGYGVADGVCMANFTTPAKPLVGEPYVEASVVDRTLYSFTVHFEPNADVMEYYTVAGAVGELQSQYEMFGPMFGFSNIADMIMAWGLAKTEAEDNTWDNMAPNTEYEIYIVALDAEGTPAPYQVFNVSTLAKGGDGESQIDITLGDYMPMDWDGVMKYSQFITFTPNDQTSEYRFNCYTADVYDENAEDIKAYLCSDPEMPTAYWFFYEPFTNEYQIDPGTECVVIAAGKNGNGEWGAVNELRFTTPNEEDLDNPTSKPASKSKGALLSRKAPRKAAANFGYRLPNLKLNKVTIK